MFTLTTGLGAANASAATNAAGLTAQQRSEITRALREQNVPQSKINGILLDRQAALAVPVRVEKSSPGLSTAGPAPGPGCNQVASHLRYHNAVGVNIWTYSINKYWCWDGQFITHVPPASNSVWVHGTLTGVWHFRGNIAQGAFEVEPWQGRFLGHQSWSQGKMEYCILKWGCFMSETPTVLVTGWGNGRFDTNAWN